MLDSFKWILTTELLGVMNEATASSVVNTEWINVKLIEAWRKCNKYLQEANDLEEITDFIASKVKIKGYKGTMIQDTLKI